MGGSVLLKTSYLSIILTAVALCENIIAYSNKLLYDRYTETHVYSFKNAFHSFSNVLSLYFPNAVDILCLW